ncbi:MULTISPECIES: MarR family winged helix-turn-helix transcriptional regulator [Lysobacter]|uniref:MarR family winged helix-turn-helix transcriptional regulator n=1 Tax=Lysobacter TaxID=68 RepID=UPI001F1D789F|nr:MULTISPECIES: MarR family winged helix-turn-helix transcriptional regulator [Lysobacter]UJB20073.1 MarR family winged helix-turn-helix transcriptional regulator [Lysobacter capsici]UJQ30812.1 MarR family winged helix-turn-helix transcriptional regulator [Lysobacter gummosus]
MNRPTSQSGPAGTAPSDPEQAGPGPTAPPVRAAARSGAALHAELDLDHFLPYRLSVLSNRVSSAIARVYSERYALSVTEWRVMAVLGRFPGLSANEVAQRTAMDKVAVSRAVARLTEAGRLERDTHDDDRRRSVLRLSPDGYKIYDEVAPMALAFEQRLLAGIESAERDALFRLLDRLDELEMQAEAEMAADKR